MSPAPEVCHHCNTQEQFKRNYSELQFNGKGKLETTKEQCGGNTGSRGSAGQTWCAHHNTTTHADSECYAHRARRPQQGSAYTSCLTQCRHPSPDGGTTKWGTNIGNDFEWGFMFTQRTTALTFLPNGQETATPVDA